MITIKKKKRTTTNLGVDRLKAFPVVLLKELVRGQVPEVVIRVDQVNVGQSELLADLRHGRKMFWRRRCGRLLGLQNGV